MKYKSRNGLIELLRFVFTMYVVVCHMYSVFDIKMRYPVNGWFALEFFFVLSGYLLMASCAKAVRCEVSLREVWKPCSNLIYSKATGMFPVWLVSWCIYFVFFMWSKNIGMAKLVNTAIQALPFLFMLSGLGLSEIFSIPYSWYIPTMLLAFTLLLPVILVYPKTFIYCIAPLIIWENYPSTC